MLQAESSHVCVPYNSTAVGENLVCCRRNHHMCVCVAYNSMRDEAYLAYLVFLIVVSCRHTPPPPFVLVICLCASEPATLVDNLLLQAEDRDVVRTYVATYLL